MTTPDVDVRAFLRQHLDGLSPLAPPERLDEGLSNVVWRVPADPDSVIVKYAPPHVAADPEIPLDSSRLTFESRALEIFETEGALASLASPLVRPPRPLAFDASIPMLAMEDVGDLPHLGEWLRESDASVEIDDELGRALGRFVGRLHRSTLDDAEIAARFDNTPIQRTRLETQYRAVGEWLEQIEVDGAEHLGRRARDLGERLLKPGRCLTMGDLWPRSILLDESRSALRLIDWEFAHVGRPIQDLAHLSAHLWMHAHRGDDGTVERCRAWGETFWHGYSKVIEPVEGEIRTERARHDAGLHVGAEILTRTIGAFRGGSLYEDVPIEGPVVAEAVATAVERMERPVSLETLFELRDV
jgi:hypothetical protein